MRAASSAPAVRFTLILAAAALSSCGARGEELQVEFDWDNGGIAENQLGKLARACCTRHCGTAVNALDLWLSLKEVII